MCGSLLSKFKSADSKIDPAMVIFPEPRVKWSLPTNVSHKCLIANIDIILFVPLNSLMFNFWPHWIKRKSSLLEMFSRLTKVSRSALDSIIAGLPSRGPLQVIWLLISSLSFASASNRVFVRKICSAYAFILVQIKLGLVLKLRHCHHVYYFIYGIILSLDSVLRPNPKYHLLKQLFIIFGKTLMVQNLPRISSNIAWIICPLPSRLERKAWKFFTISSFLLQFSLPSMKTTWRRIINGEPYHFFGLFVNI